MPLVTQLSSTAVQNLTRLEKANSLFTQAQEALSAGKITNPSQNPTAFALGQRAHTLIQGYENTAIHSVSANAVCKTILDALDNGLSILNDLVGDALSASSGTNDEEITAIMDQGFQAKLKAYQNTIENAQWNGRQILNQKHFTPHIQPYGFYNKSQAEQFSATAFTIPFNTTITGLHEVKDHVLGDFKTVYTQEDYIYMQVGEQLYKADYAASALTNHITFVNEDCHDRTLSFNVVGGATVSDIANSLQTILAGTTFKPTVKNLFQTDYYLLQK